MDTVELLRETAMRVQRISAACQKINEGIAELSAELVGAPALIKQTERDLSGLTPRHVEIIGLIAGGASLADIAKKFDLSVDTVRAHRNTIRQKLNFATSAELEQYAKEKFKG